MWFLLMSLHLFWRQLHHQPGCTFSGSWRSVDSGALPVLDMPSAVNLYSWRDLLSILRVPLSVNWTDSCTLGSFSDVLVPLTLSSDACNLRLSLFGGMSGHLPVHFCCSDALLRSHRTRGPYLVDCSIQDLEGFPGQTRAVSVCKACCMSPRDQAKTTDSH